MTDVTNWYPPEINPCYTGWYQREYETEQAIEIPDHWDGSRWAIGNGDGTLSDRPARILSWRGLTEKS